MEDSTKKQISVTYVIGWPLGQSYCSTTGTVAVSLLSPQVRVFMIRANSTSINRGRIAIL
jgi:hypothetical protein